MVVFNLRVFITVDIAATTDYGTSVDCHGGEHRFSRTVTINVPVVVPILVNGFGTGCCSVKDGRLTVFAVIDGGFGTSADGETAEEHGVEPLVVDDGFLHVVTGKHVDAIVNVHNDRN